MPCFKKSSIHQFLKSNENLFDSEIDSIFTFHSFILYNFNIILEIKFYSLNKIEIIFENFWKSIKKMKTSVEYSKNGIQSS